MLTREEFEAVVHEFLGELWATFEGQSGRPLPVQVAIALEDSLEQVQLPELSPQERVAAAFAVVNQYVESTWPRRVEEGYRLYRDLRRSGPNS